MINNIPRLPSDIVSTSPQARVFISCGQKNNTEKALGFACREYFHNRGFKTYLAEEAQNLEGLTENIFRHLRTSEYAIFIDPKRENLDGKSEFRGSLFVNQELAIAAFQQIDALVFHQEGVKLEGVAKYLIVKPIHFKNKNDFIKKLADNTKTWDPHWRNEISLESPIVAKDVLSAENRTDLIDWYHVPVRNVHRYQYARNCLVYVLRIIDDVGGKEVYSPNIELLWSGAVSAQPKHILPQKAAKVVAFFINHSKDIIEFLEAPSRSTEPEYQLPDLQAGKYSITYTVLSDNFEQVNRTFKISFGGRYDSITFTPSDGGTPNR